MNIVKSFTTIDFQLNLDRCVGSYNTLNDLSNKLCIPKKTEDLNPSVFNQWWNNDKCRCKCKKQHICEKDFGILLLVAVKMENIS